MNAVVEDLVALRLDHNTLNHSNPLHGLVAAAEAVGDMEAPRFHVATNILEAMSPTTLDHEYRATREAVLTWARGDMHSARDMLALSLPDLSGDCALLTGYLAHMADFYLGHEGGMLETGRLLVDLRSTMSRRAAGLSDGLTSFALEECGYFSEAITTAGQALSINPDDVYALHSKVHALQSLKEAKTAKDVIANYSNGWGMTEPMRIHMWWHFAMCLVEEGNLEQALLCYDLELRRKTRARAWEDLDAVALLWLLEILGGEDFYEMLASRWRVLALAWEAYAERPIYIFNDLHAAMAFAKVENYPAFDKVVAACAAREEPDFFHAACAPLFAGIAAFAQRDYATTVKLMSPVLNQQQLRVGGSKMQQRIFHRTRDAAASYLRAGNSDGTRNSQTHAFTKEI